MKDGHFINIAGWMGNRLELRGNELICFALIYSFSQDGESQFRGKLDFLAGCMFATRKTALSIIDKLLGLNHILKIEEMVNGKKRCYYQTNIIYDKGEFSVINNEKKPLTAIGKESIPVTGVNSIPETGVESIPETGVESIPVYNNNKDINNKKSINKKVPNGTKKENARFQKPTVQEVEAYIKEKGYHFDAEHFWNYYESKGWKVGNSPMKNWKAACATWESKRKSENPDKSEETTDLPAGLTPEKWEQARNWFKTRVPRIAGSITPNDHLSMMALARWKRDVYIEILIKIEASDYTGSILEEFERISETEEYSQRLWGNE